MPDPNLLILYVGNETRGEEIKRIVQERGMAWAVYVPDSAAMALRIANTYGPDVIVLDSSPFSKMCRTVYDQLREFGMGPLLVISDTPQLFTGVRTLRYGTNNQNILMTIEEIAKAKPVL